MLNLQIAMFHWILSLFFTGWFAFAQQTPAAPRIDNPLPGQALQGVVSITGSTALDGFASAQIEFCYESDASQTWFLIQEDIPAIENDVLASWDTTTLTDGVYRIRLRVAKTNGGVETVEVAGVRVRNYSAIETNTPQSQAGETQVSGATATATARAIQSTPTPQPPNPAAVTDDDLRDSIHGGLIAVAGVFLIFGFYLGVRRLGRR